VDDRDVLIPVFIEGWQIQCCVRPPDVGELVDLRLYFEEVATGKLNDRACSTELTVTAQHYPGDGWFGQFPTRLDAEGLAILWDADREVCGPVTVKGRVGADWHHIVPSEFPWTNAVVKDIAIERRHSPSGRPVHETWYEPVERSHSWFASAEPSLQAEVHRAGILVTIEPTGRPPRVAES
jgi:hypothetical protein